jgi:hypothetical protein
MPRATVSKTTERFELQTIEGGYVELRRLSYGEKMQKDAEAMKMRFAVEKGTEALDATLAMISEAASLLEFSRCVVGHNLTRASLREGEDDIPLDFRKADDVRSLDPRVGEEISTYIGQLNDFERQATTTARDAEGK